MESVVSTASRGSRQDATLDMSELDDAVGFRMRGIQQTLTRNFARHLEPLDLTPVLYVLLVLIRNNPHANQTELSRAMGVRPPNLVERLEVLRRRGLIDRRPDAQDRRANVLSLTAAGEALYRAGAEAHEAHVRESPSLLPPGVYEMLSKALTLAPAVVAEPRPVSRPARLGA